MLLGKSGINKCVGMEIYLWIVIGQFPISKSSTKLGMEFVELDLDIAEIFWNPISLLDTPYENA